MAPTPDAQPLADRATHATWRRLIALAALLSAFIAILAVRAPAEAVPATDHAGNAVDHAHGPTLLPPRTTAQVAFHDQMRKLWEDHVTWTRLAIVSFAAESAGFDETAARLLRNQADIGDAVKPFYGEKAGNQLTALLHDHITIAVELLQAAKADDGAAFEDARVRWYANSDDVADFLSAANPRWWPQADMRAAMRTHLDQTLAEAAHELAGDYAA
ncbi:MAG: hypothetical protein FWJ93_10730 [Micromonosporaceae bacterium]